jgi:hypothetical protein
VSCHRIVFRRQQKAVLVVVADRMLVVGRAVLCPRSAARSCLILDVVLGRWPAIMGSSLTALGGLLT